ncbi:hypothetical protein ABIC16_000209 [Sphingomonas sp. PvP055]|jgi:hypothetical protein|uniref:hypothetical protein n=1 Tax=Sphingomonas sp. PvP055 TaxID=3156391 RepID=UPI003397C647
MPLSWDVIGYGLAGLIGLALVARWLRLAESRIGNAAQAREMAENLLAGFVAHGAVVGTDGNAALVAGSGAVAMLKRQGTKVAARRLLPPVALSQDVEGVRVETGERMFGGVLLFGVTADEVRALEATLTFH